MSIRKNDLIKNTTLLMIGNFSSKILSFVLVPLYTYYLLPTDYGKVDLDITILSMLYIVVSLQAVESSFRFIQDCKESEDYKAVLSNSISITTFGVIIFEIFMLIFSFYSKFEYTLIYMLFVPSSIYSNLFLHTLRGMNKTKTYVLVSVLSTVISAGSNILLLVGLKYGAISLLMSPIIVNIFVILFIVFKERFYQYFSMKYVKIANIVEQLKFSIPLIPNAISIWLLSSIGRFVILFYHGTNALGILAFSLKFPMLLSTVSDIFLMAWQVSAISTYSESDKNSFASDVFNHFLTIQISALILLLPIVKFLIFNIMGDQYSTAWVYIPIFFIGIIFKSNAQFYNVGFYSAKKTNYIFQSSLIAAIVYFSISFVLTKDLYLNGIAIGYTVSELVHWLYVKNKVVPYLQIKIKFIENISLLLYCAISIIVYYVFDINVQILFFVISFVYILYINKNIIYILLKNIVGKNSKESGE